MNNIPFKSLTLVGVLLSFGCSTTLKPPPFDGTHTPEAVASALAVQVTVRSPRSGIVGAKYDGLAQAKQGDYRVEGLSAALKTRVEAAARRFGLQPRKLGEVVLKCEFRRVFVATHGVFSSGEPSVELRGTMALIDSEGATVFSKDLQHNATGIANDSGALFPEVDREIGEWFRALERAKQADPKLDRLLGAKGLAPVSARLPRTRPRSSVAPFLPVLAEDLGSNESNAVLYEQATDSADHRIGRVFLSPLMGYVGGAIGALGTLVVFNQLCDLEGSCLIPAILSALSAEMLGVAAGVTLSGSILKGMGSFGWALFGSGAAVLATLIAAPTGDPQVAGMIGAIMMPISSTVMYELVSSSNEDKAMANGGLALVPTVKQSDSGWVVGVGGSF